jgi:hypothetical protein
MTRRSEGKEVVLLSAPPLLMSESADEFASLRTALELEIKPKGIVEQIYVDDIAAIVWEIRRLRRCKTSIINTGFRAALQSLLREMMSSPQNPYDYDEADALALEWFSNQQAKDKVSAIFRRFHLDEFAVVAQATKKSLSDLELLDRMLASLESRRDKALRCVATYRDSLAKQIRQSSGRILEGGDVLRLEHAPSQKSASA